jgi:hypothetical protein
MAWSYDRADWHHQVGAGWSASDVFIEEDATVRFRGAFWIGGGDVGDPIQTGDVIVQRFWPIVGGSWVDWPSYYANNLRPGYHLFPIGSPPDYGIWDIDFTNVLDEGENLRTRLKVTWIDGDHFSPEIVVRVVESQVITTEVDADGPSKATIAAGLVVLVDADSETLATVAGCGARSADVNGIRGTAAAAAATRGADADGTEKAASAARVVVSDADGAPATATAAGVLAAADADGADTAAVAAGNKR